MPRSNGSSPRDPITGQLTDEPLSLIETKEFFRTSEFGVFALFGAGLGITTLAADTFTAVDAWPLLTLLAAAYILSRGVAKAGSPHLFSGRDSVREIAERFVGRDEASVSQRRGDVVGTQGRDGGAVRAGVRPPRRDVYGEGTTRPQTERLHDRWSDRDHPPRPPHDDY